MNPILQSHGRIEGQMEEAPLVQLRYYSYYEYHLFKATFPLYGALLASYISLSSTTFMSCSPTLTICIGKAEVILFSFVQECTLVAGVISVFILHT